MDDGPYGGKAVGDPGSDSCSVENVSGDDGVVEDVSGGEGLGGDVDILGGGTEGQRSCGCPCSEAYDAGGALRHYCAECARLCVYGDPVEKANIIVSLKY